MAIRKPEKQLNRSSSDDQTLRENGNSHTMSDEKQLMADNARLANPLAKMSKDDLLRAADDFVRECDLEDIRGDITKGALVAGNPNGFEGMSELSPEEKEAFRVERDNKWKQPKTLYALVVACSMAAVVQGQDQSLIVSLLPPSSACSILGTQQLAR